MSKKLILILSIHIILCSCFPYKNSQHSKETEEIPNNTHKEPIVICEDKYNHFIRKENRAFADSTLVIYDMSVYHQLLPVQKRIPIVVSSTGCKAFIFQYKAFISNDTLLIIDKTNDPHLDCLAPAEFVLFFDPDRFKHYIVTHIKTQRGCEVRSVKEHLRSLNKLWERLQGEKSNK